MGCRSLGCLQPTMRGGCIPLTWAVGLWPIDIFSKYVLVCRIGSQGITRGDGYEYAVVVLKWGAFGHTGPVYINQGWTVSVGLEPKRL